MNPPITVIATLLEAQPESTLYTENLGQKPLDIVYKFKASLKVICLLVGEHIIRRQASKEDGEMTLNLVQLMLTILA